MNTTTMSTIDQTIETFVRTMTEQGAALKEQLKELDDRYQSDRAGLMSQIAAVDRALAAMKVKGQAQAGLNFAKRAPMSEQGKENIRKALAARRERLAAVNGATPAETTPAAPAATEEQSVAQEAEAPTKKTAKKGAAK